MMLQSHKHTLSQEPTSLPSLWEVAIIINYTTTYIWSIKVRMEKAVFIISLKHGDPFFSWLI
jgi:hypothetical protein